MRCMSSSNWLGLRKPWLTKKWFSMREIDSALPGSVKRSTTMGLGRSVAVRPSQVDQALAACIWAIWSLPVRRLWKAASRSPRSSGGIGAT